jgi:ATP-dependent RNA helicase DDX24/MAK5
MKNQKLVFARQSETNFTQHSFTFTALQCYFSYFIFLFCLQMSSKDHKHLNDLSKLRFLVVDEVDRMISKGSYPQLLNIFESINKANPIVSESEPSRETMQEDDSDDDGSRLKGLKGIPGESRVVMLNEDVLKQIEAQKKGYVVDTTDQGQDDHSSQSSIHFESMPHNDHDDDDDQSLQSGVAQEIIHRQTFVFSATLSLPNTAHQIIKQARTSLYKKGKALDSNASVESTIQDILRTAGARGQLKFVDLSTNSSNPSIHDKSETLRADRKAIQLPPGLSLYEILCTKKHKDSHLYAFLVTTKQGSSGPCLVFCNSIAAVKRVSQTLRELGLPVRTLHAHMEQKARLSAIESLKGNDSRVILIATDVAARGLDIPSVANVIHYDVARAVDTFVHRAGRTARGVGSSAVGTSVSLVDPSEEKSHRKICESIRGQGIRRFEQPSIDGHLLSSAQTRVALASKIVDSDMIKVKARKNNDWISVAAADADLDLDEDLLDQGPSDGSLRDQQRLKEVSKARLELKRLLAVPMKKQHFGKFLSGVGIKNAINSMGSVVPYVVGHK